MWENLFIIVTQCATKEQIKDLTLAIKKYIYLFIFIPKYN
jgi:hypothetical protein